MSPRTTPKQTVLVVHGTFAGRPHDSRRVTQQKEPALWYEPGGEFCNKLDSELAKRGSSAKCWQHLKDGEEHFSWDGANNWLSRSRAAFRLRHELEALHASGWIVHLVGHSHGGNVIIDAVTPDRKRAFPWFKARAVLLGTPIYLDSPEYARRQVRLQRRWMLVSICFWAVLLFVSTRGVSVVAALNDPWAQNLVTPALLIALFAGSVLVIRAAFRFAEERSVRAGLLSMAINPTQHSPSEETRKSPPFLVIGSRFDEAFKGLSAIRGAPNPFIQESDTENASAREIVRPVANSVHTVVQRTLNAKRLWPFVLASVVLIVIASFWKQLALVRGPGTVTDVGLSLTFLILLSTVVTLVAVYHRFFHRVLLAPGAMIYSALHLVAGTITGAVLYQFEGTLKKLVWGFVKVFGLGVSGGPRGADDVQVTREFDDPQDCLYLELPESIVDEVKTQQQDRLVEFQELLYSSELKWDPLAIREKLEGRDFPMVHTTYYKQDACLQKIAEWICEPMKTLMDFTRTVETRKEVSTGCFTIEDAVLPNEYVQHWEQLRDKYEQPDWGKPMPPTPLLGWGRLGPRRSGRS